MDNAGQQFGTVARTYHQSRPLLPAEAMEWLTDSPDRPYLEVLDLGAGTGRFTAQLMQRIPVVHAVEPDMRMLTVLRRTCLGAVASLGTAESLPLADNAVDAVFAVGSWHWFEHEAATAEIARVLQPGGRLGVAWNVPDDAAPWVAELNEIIQRRHEPGREPGVFVLPDGAPFTPPERRLISWQWEVSSEDLLLSLGTYSHVLAKPPLERAMLLGKAERYLARHPELVENDVVRVPIRTVCGRAQLRS